MAKKGGKGIGRGAGLGSGGGLGGGGGVGGEGGGASKNKNQTIVLLATGGADPDNPKLAAAGKNRVRWDNQTERGLTLTFDYWPFIQPPMPIPIEAGKKSKWFDTIVNLPKGKYSYSIEPDLSIDSAPDPPGVSFNG